MTRPVIDEDAAKEAINRDKKAEAEKKKPSWEKDPPVRPAPRPTSQSGNSSS